VLPLHGDAIDTLARADTIVFDKTGTLGDGRPAIADVECFGDADPEQALHEAAALERDSRHPLARAFAQVATPCIAENVRETAGAGIEGRVDGRLRKLGRRDFVARDDGDSDVDGLWLGDGERVLARFRIEEGLREAAAEAVAMLEAQGLAPRLCSGDGAGAVARLARAVGIDDARSRQSPAQKLGLARELQANGHVVAMVGDGLNDAPVLAGADVSFAMSDGAALAQRAADFVVTSPSLLRIPQAVALARRTRAIVRQNLAWALAYNLVALPLAASGHVSPWLAALGMAASSLLVTLNALRLARTRATVAAA
jgi:Cu2+-exporting ATPase